MCRCQMLFSAQLIAACLLIEENRAAKRRIYRGNSATIKAARMSRYLKGRRTTTTTTTTTQRYVIACYMYHLKSKGCYARGSWLPVMHTLTLLYACMTYYQMYSMASYTGCSLVKVNVCTKGYQVCTCTCICVCYIVNVMCNKGLYTCVYYCNCIFRNLINKSVMLEL